jgi:hypothetical protein
MLLFVAKSPLFQRARQRRVSAGRNRLINLAAEDDTRKSQTGMSALRQNRSFQRWLSVTCPKPVQS